MSRISIVVPVYRTEAFLGRCLADLLHQTHTDNQYVLTDDGSPDTSAAICDETAASDDRVLVIHQKNGGQSAARNRGLSLIEGTYLYFCDSDDGVEPDLLLAAETVLETEKSDLVRFQCFTHREGRVTVSSFRFPDKAVGLASPADTYAFLLDTVIPYRIGWETCFSLFRTDLIRRHALRFPDGINIAEDQYFLMLFLAFASRISFLDRPLYHYYLRGTSTMGANNGDLRMREKAELLRRLCRQLPDSYDREPFYPIHNAVVQGLLGPYLDPLSKPHADVIRSAAEETGGDPFFAEQTLLARKHLGHVYRKKHGLYRGTKMQILNRYLCSRRFGRFLFLSRFWETLTFPFRLAKRACGYLRRHLKCAN